MKNYIKPEFTINLFDVTDVLTNSPNDNGHNIVDVGNM